MPDLSRTISIELDYAEAFVLSHLLARLQNGEGFHALAKDRAEGIALESLTAILESVIDDVFSEDYAETLHACKERLELGGF